MTEPTTVAELMNFVYGVAWFRGHIPYFAEIAGPLYDLIKEALEPYKKKTSANAKKVAMPAWKEKGRAAFKAVKDALVQGIATAYFDPDKKTCVFADASNDFWCIMITQCPPTTSMGAAGRQAHVARTGNRSFPSRAKPLAHCRQRRVLLRGEAARLRTLD